MYTNDLRNSRGSSAARPNVGMTELQTRNGSPALFSYPKKPGRGNRILQGAVSGSSKSVAHAGERETGDLRCLVDAGRQTCRTKDVGSVGGLAGPDRTRNKKAGIQYKANQKQSVSTLPRAAR